MIATLAMAALAVSSQVSEVTVYNDRAQVVRTARVELDEGFNTVVFEALPAAIDARGIQVDGSGAATVLDVRFKTENLIETDDAVLRGLHDRLEALRDEEQQIHLRITRFREAREFLSRISSKVTHRSDKEGELELDPAKWADMLALYAERSTDYDERIQAAELELKEVRNVIGKVEADIRDAGSVMKKKRRLVEVDLEAGSAGPAELHLSYLVSGPYWQPAYDVRVDSETRSMEIKCFALVRQNTGEDWSGVALRLSTARPGLGGQHPELSVWRIDVQPDVQVREVHRYAQDWDVEVGQRTAPVVRPQQWAFESVTAGVLSSMGGVPQLATRSTSTSMQGTAVLFDVAGSTDIDSDNVEHRVSIASLELPAHFRYSCVPKLDQYVYLKARGVNEADYPLLKGRANVYLDGSYVATSEMDFVAPGEEFWTFLGVDESIRVDYRLVNRHESREGLTGRTVRHTYEYLFKVRNTHGRAEELIIFDQLPVSGDEDVEVELVQPKYSGDSDAIEINDEQRIKWFLVLEPGAALDLPFVFRVEAPKDVEITGLE